MHTYLHTWQKVKIRGGLFENCIYTSYIYAHKHTYVYTKMHAYTRTYMRDRHSTNTSVTRT